MFNVFAQILTQEAKDKIHAERKCKKEEEESVQNYVVTS